MKYLHTACRGGGRISRVFVGLGLVLAGGSLFGLAPFGRVPLLAASWKAAHPRFPEEMVPAELNALVERATANVNAGDLARLAPLTEENDARTFDWTHVPTEPWEGDVLAIPPAERAGGQEPPAERAEASIGEHDAPLRYLAVFHAWHTCESAGDHVYRLVQTNGNWRIGPEIPETDTGGFRVRDHDLHVAVDVDRKTADIDDRVKVERTQDGLPAFGLLRISQDYRVRQLTRNGPDGLAVSFRQVGGVLAFIPPQEKTFTLYLKYTGQLDHRESDYIHDFEASIDSYWYPTTARLPATATVTTTAPPGWMAVAQGERIRAVRAANGGLTVTYRNDIPTSYFTLDMGRYVITSRQAGGRTLSVYQLSSNPPLARQCLDVLEHALAFYDTHFAPFPYTHYGVVETKGAFAGALEAYSFATFGPQTLPELIPHELSHTWWGGLVPCAYTRSMWNESFAEYSDALFQRMTAAHTNDARPRREDPARLLQERQRRTHAFDSYTLLQAHDTDDEKQVAVGYEKGRMVMRALEDLIGPEAMLRCLHTFVVDHPRGEAAEWPEFEAVVRKVTGKDYRWFFAQWLERTGIPRLRLTGVTARQEGADTIVEGEIEQEGIPYRLRLPVLLETRNGAVTAMVDIDGPRPHLRLKAGAAPTRLTLDPEGVVPLGLPSHGSANADPTAYAFPN